MIKEYQEFKRQNAKLLETLTENEKKELEDFEHSLLESLQRVADLLSSYSAKTENQ